MREAEYLVRKDDVATTTFWYATTAQPSTSQATTMANIARDVPPQAFGAQLTWPLDTSPNEVTL